MCPFPWWEPAEQWDLHPEEGKVLLREWEAEPGVLGEGGQCPQLALARRMPAGIRADPRGVPRGRMELAAPAQVPKPPAPAHSRPPVFQSPGRVAVGPALALSICDGGGGVARWALRIPQEAGIGTAHPPPCLLPPPRPSLGPPPAPPLISAAGPLLQVPCQVQAGQGQPWLHHSLPLLSPPMSLATATDTIATPCSICYPSTITAYPTASIRVTQPVHPGCASTHYVTGLYPWSTEWTLPTPTVCPACIAEPSPGSSMTGGDLTQERGSQGRLSCTEGTGPLP